MTPEVARDVTTLDRFGVAFAVFNRVGERIRRSAAAIDLLGARPDEWDRIADQVRAFQSVGTALARERQTTSISATACSIHWLIDECAIVVFHPIAPNHRGDRPHWADLTERERQVAECIACGRTSRELAQSLGISVHTARRHTESVYAKLGVRRRTDVTRIALTPASQSPTLESAATTPPSSPTSQENNVEFIESY